MLFNESHIFQELKIDQSKICFEQIIQNLNFSYPYSGSEPQKLFSWEVNTPKVIWMKVKFGNSWIFHEF